MGLFRTTYRDKRGQLKKSPNWYIDYYANGRRVREKVGPSRRGGHAGRSRLRDPRHAGDQPQRGVVVLGPRGRA